MGKREDVSFFFFLSAFFFPLVGLETVACTLHACIFKNINCIYILLQVDHHWNEAYWEKNSSEGGVFNKVSDDLKVLRKYLHVLSDI